MAREGDERAVVQSVRVDASRATVWRCVTRPELLSKWLEAEVSIEPRRGGAVRIDFARYGTVVVGEVVEVDEPRAIAFTWGVERGPQAGAMPPGSTRVRITLEDDGDGTRVTLRHEGFPTEKEAQDHRGGWAAYLTHLPATATLARIEGGADALWDRWFGCWSETDRARRDAALASCTTADVGYRDVHADVTRRNGVSQWMATCQGLFPGVRVVRSGPTLHSRGSLLVEWDVKAPDGTTVARGASHARLSPDGLLAAIDAFWR